LKIQLVFHFLYGNFTIVMPIFLFFSIACVDYDISRRMMVDSYVQPVRESGVDILWVVDNSASMFEEQDQLAEHADSFTDYLKAAPVDFQLSVISTDVFIEQPGVFVDEPLTSESEGLAESFAGQIFMDEGSRDEQGFEATLAALDSSGPNSETLRNDADLEIIFFSDEDDQSTVEVDSFLNSLVDLRSESKISVNAITGDPPEGCASIYGAADPGFKYQEVQESTEGTRESICSLDYEAMLSRVALKVLGLETTFALNAAPDLDTMEVLVDGAMVHRRKRHGWQYDAGLNAIVFDGYAVPQPGAEIILKYYLWIGPASTLEESLEEESEESEE
jgi:hypothetical protein